MAISEAFAGSASIGTTEYDLPTASTVVTPQTTDGIYQAYINFFNLTATESYRLRIYEKVQSSSTQRVVQEVVIYGAQTTEPVYVTPALLLLHGWTFTLTKLQGTSQTIEWSIRQVA